MNVFAQGHFLLLVFQGQSVDFRFVRAGGFGRFDIQFFDMGPKVGVFFFRGAQLAFGFFNAAGVDAVNGELFPDLFYFELQRGFDAASFGKLQLGVHKIFSERFQFVLPFVKPLAEQKPLAPALFLFVDQEIFLAYGDLKYLLAERFKLSEGPAKRFFVRDGINGTFVNLFLHTTGLPVERWMVLCFSLYRSRSFLKREKLANFRGRGLETGGSLRGGLFSW
ncbi:MAG: hypothetical protein MR616_07045 [Pyramidobacter sp.]|nr:hypothetical protein [Pyramidobacter sp.]